jgi:threonine aldolase
MTSAQLSALLRRHGVLANGVGPDQLRFVTHFDVNREQCARAVEVVAMALGAKVATTY